VILFESSSVVITEYKLGYFFVSYPLPWMKVKMKTDLFCLELNFHLLYHDYWMKSLYVIADIIAHGKPIILAQITGALKF